MSERIYCDDRKNQSGRQCDNVIDRKKRRTEHKYENIKFVRSAERALFMTIDQLIAKIECVLGICEQGFRKQNSGLKSPQENKIVNCNSANSRKELASDLD